MVHAVNGQNAETLSSAHDIIHIAETLLAKTRQTAAVGCLSEKTGLEAEKLWPRAVGADRRRLERDRQAGNPPPPSVASTGIGQPTSCRGLCFVWPSIPHRHLDGDSRHHGRPRARLAAEVLGVLLHVGDRPQSVDKLIINTIKTVDESDDGDEDDGRRDGRTERGCGAVG